MPADIKARAANDLPTTTEAVLTQARAEGKSITLVTGVFDLLHPEHKNFLQKAKALGGILVVGLESDSRVKQLKGPDRPVNQELLRAQQIMDLHLADAVFILPEQFGNADDHRALIQHIKPKYLAVSSHTPHLEAKRRLLNEVGGEVVIVHQQNPAVSTTQMLAQK